MKQSKLLCIVLAVATALFILTAAIAAPILLRPFYYAHITALRLEETTGLTRAQIITAYDQVLDYCTGRTEVFSAGGLAFTQAGRAHFTDVRQLFLLDLWAAALAGLALLGWTLLRPLVRIRPCRFRKRGFLFWGSTGLGAAILCVGGLAASDFDRAFVVFHLLFFPGKDNWLFDPRFDAVIRILPQEFFRNCALFILLLIVALCAVCILLDKKKTAAE
ncbi:MAG: TIGR01906 family membrane protein [Oscillospiraceae bacterium]|nr:TIGR01906 family membrane protein [Oscillospiraceae bacterium]